ncbi:hypothetical protein SAMN05414137_104198 [Streptacidiphilus jiangxiensis]|uniref:EcsC protein family protein n=1 Tax=Streptacidiphilus jiangxiensis TaxID=235985 RepID=A0A1H7KTE8_STRJI|nr:hypothetical protein SAMN05414137_104198 [Streptacidiphilus jiangxiensis]
MGPFRKPQRSVGAGQEPAVDKSVEDETTADLARIADEMEVWDGSAGADSVPAAEQGRMAALARKLGRSLGRGAKDGAVGLVDRLMAAAPRIKVRDVATLRAHHPDARSAEELADRIAAAGARASGAVGAGAGAAAMMPVPAAMPVEIAAELLAVASVEFKMIAELYEAYGQPAQGNAKQRALAYLSVWSERRGLDVASPATILALSKTAGLRTALRKRLTRAGVRKLPSLAPLMVGAAAGAYVNRRDTAKLAAEIRRDLRERRPSDPSYWLTARPDPDEP